MPNTVTQFSLYDWLRGQAPDVRLFVRLYQGTYAESDMPGLSDFHEANFAGYEERLFQLFAAPDLDAFGTYSARSEIIGWSVLSDAGVINTIGGYYIVAKMADGTEELVVWEPYEESRVMDHDGATFGMIAVLIAGQSLV